MSFIEEVTFHFWTIQTIQNIYTTSVFYTQWKGIQNKKGKVKGAGA